MSLEYISKKYFKSEERFHHLTTLFEYLGKHLKISKYLYPLCLKEFSQTEILDKILKLKVPCHKQLFPDVKSDTFSTFEALISPFN